MDKKTFSITAAKQAIKLDSKRTGEVSFTVTNTSDKPARGQLKIRPVDGPSLTAAQPVWLTLAGDTERNFAPQATTQVTAKITVPDTVQPGKYGFRLDAVSAADPDDDLTEGPSMILELAAAQPVTKKGFPWWIVIAVGAAVLVIGGVVLWLVLSSGGVTVPDMKNQTADQAKKALTDVKLAFKEEHQKENSAPPGSVISQDPAPGAKVKSGSTVKIVVADPVDKPAPKPVPTPVPNPVPNPVPKPADKPVIDTTKYYRLQLRHGGMYSDASYCTDTVKLSGRSDYENGACQLWKFVPASEGWYRLQLKHGGKYLDASYCTDDTKLSGLSTWEDGACQLWRIVPFETGWYRLQLKHGGKYLDASYCTVNIKLSGFSDYENGACQLWAFIPE